MDNIFRKDKILFYLSYIIVVFSLTNLLALGINLDLNIIKQIIFVTLGSFIVKFILFNPLVFYIIILLIIISLVIVDKYFLPIIVDILEYFYLLLLNILANLQGKENILTEYLFVYYLILIAVVSFFTAYFIFKKKKISYILPIYIFSFLYYWYNYFDEAYLMFSLFLVGYFTNIGLKKYNNRENIDYYLWLKTTLIYSLIIVSLSFFIPKTNFNFKWDYLNEKVTTYFPFIKDLRHDEIYLRSDEVAETFDFTTTGFQNQSTKLGGSVILDEKLVMIVQSDKPLYLRGNVKLNYNNNSWALGNDSFEKYSSNEEIDLAPAKDKRYYEEKSIKIRFEDFSSITIFSPYLPKSMYFKESSPLYLDKDYVVLFPEGVYKNEIYTMKYNNPLPFHTLLSLGINKTIDDLDNIQDYLQLPKNQISNDTIELVESIVKNSIKDYEKAVAVENHLRNNYEYSLEVDEIPDGKEFIDYFLFHEKKGYCTYFATTMAIMLRLQGIPSRYIEGYIVKDEIEPGVYEVRSKNAHTWVEAYIEPVGWMIFEPTPIFPRENRRLGYLTEVFDHSSDYETGEILIDNIQKPDKEVLIDDGIEKSKTQDIDDLDIVIEEDKSNSYFIFIILLLIIFTRIVIGLVFNKYKVYNYKKLTNRDKILYLYNEILKNAALINYPMLPGETHFEYANRAIHQFSYYNDFNILNITEIFVRIKYSFDLGTEEEVIFFEKFIKIQNQHLKKYLGIFKYFRKKYKVK